MSLVDIAQATITAVATAIATVVALGAKSPNNQRRLALAPVKAQ